MPSGTPGGAGLLCWLKASITLGVFATGGGGVGARGSVEREGESSAEGHTSGITLPAFSPEALLVSASRFLSLFRKEET